MKSQNKRRLLGLFGSLYFYALLYATQHGATSTVVALECGYTQFGYICDTIDGVSTVFAGFIPLIIAITAIIVIVLIVTFISDSIAEFSSAVKKKLK